MHTHELFFTFVRRLIFAFLLIVLGASVSHAQNAGNVGIYTKEVAVFTAQATTSSSAVFPDFGFGANFLSYCNTSFTGTIDLEWKPPGTASFIVLSQASYNTADSACHVLQLGGYFPNLRSTLTHNTGSVSAWYTASAAPLSYAPPSLGSNGTTSPITCDQNAIVNVATATNAQLISPINTGDTLVICGLTVSFNGSTSAGQLDIAWSATSGGCGSAGNTNWSVQTAASTPQLFTSLLPIRSPYAPGYPYACIENSTGAQATVSVSYASVHGL
jgi:hypothetical protein